MKPVIVDLDKEDNLKEILEKFDKATTEIKKQLLTTGDCLSAVKSNGEFIYKEE